MGGLYSSTLVLLDLWFISGSGSNFCLIKYGAPFIKQKFGVLVLICE